MPQKNLTIISSLIFFLGITFALTHSFTIFLALPLLLALTYQRCILIFLLPLLFLEPLPTKLQGTVTCEVKAISPTTTGHRLKVLSHFDNQSIPCTLHRKGSAPTSTFYTTNATLHGQFLKATTWTPLDQGPSLAYRRYLAKQKVSQSIFSKIKNPQTAAFLCGLFTGECQDAHLLNALRKTGLQHLLAVSGLHFSILLLFFSLIFRPFLHPKLATFFLLVLAITYFLFIGPTPSVARAWISSSLFLLSTLFQKRTDALTRLGFALFMILLFSPTSALELGMQLSFLATFSILLFFHPLDTFLNRIWGQRSWKTTLHMHPLSQVGHVILMLLRKALSLTLAVHLTLLPLLLLIFHQFPLLSLIYNLFFPLFMPLIFLLFLLSFIPPFAFLCEKVTTTLLRTALFPPPALSYTLYADWLTFPLVITYLLLLLFIGLYFYEGSSEKWRDYI